MPRCCCWRREELERISSSPLQACVTSCKVTFLLPSSSSSSFPLSFSFFDAAYADGSLDWAFRTTEQKNSSQGLMRNQSNWPRGKVLGGSSSLNYMVWVRGNPVPICFLFALGLDRRLIDRNNSLLRTTSTSGPRWGVKVGPTRMCFPSSNEPKGTRETEQKPRPRTWELTDRSGKGICCCSIISRWI